MLFSSSYLLHPLPFCERYILSAGDPAIYALVFESGDDVMKKLKTFDNDHKLNVSRFTAVGAFSKAMLGYCDYSIKDYKKIPVNKQVEVLSFLGDIALYGDELQVYVHVVPGRETGEPIGGFSAESDCASNAESNIGRNANLPAKCYDKETGLALIVID